MGTQKSRLDADVESCGRDVLTADELFIGKHLTSLRSRVEGNSNDMTIR